MKIVTDSAADIPIQEVKSLGLIVAPLHIKFPEGEISSEELTPDEFYTRLREMEPQIPTTSQPSSGVFSQIYQSLAKTGEAIFSIHISSGLSGTIESARLAAQHETGLDVTVIDSLTLSGGQRFQVLAAVMGAKAGLGKQALVDRLAKIRTASETAFTLETLTYLARGGRIGRVQALAGSLLKIKPVIAVGKDDGKYDSVGKERTLPRAIEAIVDYHAKAFGQSTPLWATVMHGQFSAQAEALQDMLRKRLNIVKTEILRVSPVLGVHTGPGVVGAAVVPMELLEGLN